MDGLRRVHIQFHKGILYLVVFCLYIMLLHTFTRSDSFRARMNFRICWERVECTETTRSTRSWTGLFAELLM